ncbi:TorD/DmsD family molecular chaperone [Actinomyces qiguomingii]|uniref:TorD/DmsD family molecular chaperone n=1 Tax=Actinomyces qiguomingii TaxID=2057800 RepID=UPI000CA0204D|nr:molecular chaperone TorD family protein [Actinomyces qiguomingii]
MLSDDLLERFGAALSVLGRLHLSPANQDTISQMLRLSDQWPLGDVVAPDSPTGRLTRRGWQGLIASQRDGESAESVWADQDRLYGITATAAVPPFESVHREEEGLVFGDHTLQVRRAYRRLGLHAPHLNREPDDHLGLELDFLARCCQTALEAADSGRPDRQEQYEAAAREFTEAHLLAWAPAMLQRAALEAHTHWVRGLELLTLATVLMWAQALGSPLPDQDEEGYFAVRP